MFQINRGAIQLIANFKFDSQLQQLQAHLSYNDSRRLRESRSEGLSNCRSNSEGPPRVGASDTPSAHALRPKCACSLHGPVSAQLARERLQTHILQESVFAREETKLLWCLALWSEWQGILYPRMVLNMEEMCFSISNLQSFTYGSKYINAFVKDLSRTQLNLWVTNPQRVHITEWEAHDWQQ